MFSSGHFLLAVFLLIFLIGGTMSIDYYPKGYFDSSDVTTVTWAHGVNSVKMLEDNLKNPLIRMLEGDIVIGRLANSTEETVIMAHPPETVSDLSFEMFVNEVIQYNKNRPLGERKGMKLDFKDIEAAERGLPQVRSKDPNEMEFPIWINADVLKGPVNASPSKVDGKRLIHLQKENVPRGALSLGWTTKFGKQSSGEIINNGTYTREQVQEMANLIKESYTGGDSKAEITFPLRAGIAIKSVDNIKYLLDESGIDFASPSVTLWEGKEDPPLEKKDLEEFISSVNKSRVFIDLPYTLARSSGTRSSLSLFASVILITLNFLLRI